MGWDSDPGIPHNRMKDGCIAVIRVLTAGEKEKKEKSNA